MLQEQIRCRRTARRKPETKGYSLPTSTAQFTRDRRRAIV